MPVSFSDFVLLSDALTDEDQLDEAVFSRETLKKLFDAARKKLGAKASDGEVEDEVERLKKTDPKELKKIKTTKQSREFHARKAEAAKSRKPTGTVGTTQAELRFNRTPVGSERAGHSRAMEYEWTAPKKVNEAKDFEVLYKLKTGDKEFKWRSKGRDVADVKRKFGDAHYGAKLLSIKPVKPKIVKIED